MWWEPRDEGEADLQHEVYRLLYRYQDSVHTDSVVRGVGAGEVAGDRPDGSDRRSTGWRPLVLVDDRSVGEWSGTPARFGVGELDPRSPAAYELRSWDLDDDTLLEPVGPVVPAVSPGNPYTGAGPATVGLPVTTQAPDGTWSGHGFLTVAHGVGQVGATVSVAGRGGPATGQVVFRDESARAGKAGDDIALVALDPPHTMSGWLVNQGVRPAPGGPPYTALPVDLYGGVSRGVVGQVDGVLLQHGDQTWQWRDCWSLGVTQPLMQRGDSGALAIDPGGNPFIFGHFVGGALALRGTGFANHWVQDLGQVLQRQPALDSMIRY